MSRKISSIILALCATIFLPSAFSQNVFVMPPGDGVLRPIVPFTADPFAQAGSGVAAAQDSFLAFSNAAGTKYFFVGRSSTDTVVITDSAYNVVTRLNLGTGATAAAISGDGRYLVVAAGSIQIISTVTNQVVTTLDGGIAPNDVAIAKDSSKAFITSQSSSRFTAVDLNSLVISGTLQNLGPLNGVSVGPNALVYVAAQNALYEIDPRDLSIRGGAAISLNAQPGKPAFAADDFGNIRVVMPNINPAFGGSTLITIDLGTRTATYLPANGIILDKVIPVSSTRVFATSSNLQLYDIFLPSSFNTASFGGLTSTSGVRAAVASNEASTSRFLYLTFSTSNSVARIDLSTNTLSGTLPLSNIPGPLAFAGPSSTNSISRVITYNNNQFVNPSTNSLPLVVRAVDSNGRGIANLPVSFNTLASGALVNPQTATTNADGFAQSVVLAPSTFGPFNVTATVGSVITVATTFNLTVGSGTVGPTGGIGIVSGNGQVIRETAITPSNLTIVVRDTLGNPIPNAVVNWNISSGGGNLASTQTFTDFYGQSTNTFIAPFLGPNQLTSYAQSTITATSGVNSVNFYVTVIPNQFGANVAPLPTVQILQPANTDTITGQAGTTISSAIQIRVTAGAGPGFGLGIPNVGVSVSTGLDPTIGPSATCTSTTGLTDTSGLATCDLALGNKIGTTQITIGAGGSSVATLNLIVTPGIPGKITLLQGDNQQGNPGQTLPNALLARVEDGYGNVLPGVPVTWSVVSGSATLANTISRSDSLGRVSTLLKLGSTPGAVKISVTAQGGTTAATYTFTATVNVTATSITKVSGDGQSAIVNQAFGSPLVVRVTDANGQGVPGLGITFAVNSGSAALSSTSVNSDSSGNASVSVTAGSSPGPVTITASFGNNTVSWTLTVRPLGPTLTASGIRNAASGSTDIAPGTIATITGSNIAPSVNGYALPQFDFGPRPTTLAGVSVAFGGVSAPIFWVANVGGQQTVAVQVPFEAVEGATIPVTVSSNNTSASVNITIASAAPGIFESTDSQGRRYAVVTRMDGSFVTPDNPIGRGERARVYVTGLGRTNAPATTNSYGGTGMIVNAPVIVGVNDAGVNVVSAEYAFNLIGVYVVTFDIPQNTTPGTNRGLAVAVDAGGGNLIFGNGSAISIR
ncbi:MAG: hypothetical protein IT165_22485 [Bryobacterales bacterium]|nr:hypothetical protein [Bryobacterales bacterium]